MTEPLPGPSSERAAIDTAARAVRVHCAVEWPAGPRCNNCRLPHPCPVFGWAVALLVRAGWTAVAIAELDRRTGPWA